MPGDQQTDPSGSQAVGETASQETSKSTKNKPSRPPRKNSIKWLFAKLAFSCLLIGVVFFGALYFYYQDNISQPRQFNNQIFTIKSGQSFASFAKKLVSIGVIQEPYTFQLLARQEGLAGSLHTGQYQLADGLSLRAILQQVTSGKGQITHRLRFVQGSTFKQLLAALREETRLVQELNGLSGKALMQQLFDRDVEPEGLFYPDTYQFKPGESDISILRRAYALMEQKLDKAWAGRAPDQPHTSAYEALIMASIIEKETAQANERPLISGVFTNRLNIGMRLQTDPTVIYGIGDAYTGNITRKHLKTDTPYNTYTRSGLPPGPICLPGEAALDAAVNPDKTKALYFVAKGDGDGGHYFSETLKQHNAAVRQYHINRKKRG